MFARTSEDGWNSGEILAAGSAQLCGSDVWRTSLPTRSVFPLTDGSILREAPNPILL